MKLKLTKELTRDLKALAATFAIGAITGTFSFAASASTTLRLLADEIDKQNAPK